MLRQWTLVSGTCTSFLVYRRLRYSELWCTCVIVPLSMLNSPVVLIGPTRQPSDLMLHFLVTQLEHLAMNMTRTALFVPCMVPVNVMLLTVFTLMLSSRTLMLCCCLQCARNCLVDGNMLTRS